MQVCSSCFGDLKDYGGYKDKMNPNGINLTDVWYDIPPVRHAKYKKRNGANELSIKLLDRIIEMSTDEGDIVFDPFGGSGTTYVVSEIKKNPLVSHVQFENDTHFYKENQFLYIRYQDLQDIHTRIKKLKEEKILQENPLWVNLMEADSLKEPTIEEVSFSDIEQKYLAKLKNSFQNDDGTIRVLDIYPTNNISSLSSSRKVYHSIKKIVDQENKDSIEVQYTGQVYHVIKTGKTLLPESQNSFIKFLFIGICY